MKFSTITFILLFIALFSGCADNDISQQHNSQSINVNVAVNSNQASTIKPASITASKSDSTGLPSKASDNDFTTVWNSGGGAPQWIQFDLGQASSVSKIRLNISQEPAGRTVHEIYGGTMPDKLDLLGTLDNNTKDNQWIELSLSNKSIRYLKVNTTISPSWISWREIEIVK